jgi:hypothetical protein
MQAGTDMLCFNAAVGVLLAEIKRGIEQRLRGQCIQVLITT